MRNHRSFVKLEAESKNTNARHPFYPAPPISGHTTVLLRSDLPAAAAAAASDKKCLDRNQSAADAAAGALSYPTTRLRPASSHCR